METDKTLVSREAALDIDIGKVEERFKSIKEFQALVRKSLIPDADFGTIPGTKRPTLFKPGAEKIAKLMGLSDRYEILREKEDYDKGFFAYTFKCILISIKTDKVISEGVGSCNSKESKYCSEKVDIFSVVNTILKMAKKRAMVDAVLSAGRLSEVFTQDVEDIAPKTPSEPKKAQYVPPKQPTQGDTSPVFRFGKYKDLSYNYINQIAPDYFDWCLKNLQSESLKKEISEFLATKGKEERDAFFGGEEASE